MRRLTSMLGLMLATSSIAIAQTSSTLPFTPISPAVDPTLPDPATRSGWIRVEVAVITDESVAALNAETWPVTPETHYPNQWRWLKDLEEPSQLSEQFLGADVSVDQLGAVTINLPLPPEPEPDPEMVALDAMNADGITRETSGESLAMGAATSPSIDPLTGRPEDALLTNAVPLESLGARPAQDPTEPLEDDWLEPFAENNSLADAAASLESGEATDEEPPLDTPEEPVYVPPPEPVAFARRPTAMLSEGLRSLARQRGTPAVIEAAWVQPPGNKNLPIILDDSGDAGMWPALQGFVELRRGNDLRVGVNFWLNTMGEYFPAGFAMDPPPRAEQRIKVVDAEPTPLLGTELGPGTDLAIAGELRPAGSDNSRADSMGDGMVTFVDPLTGLDTTGPAGNVETGSVTDIGTWPYRHLIQVADTRSVPENGVRYYDHPVVQVVVTWKELTWGEVWTLGEEDAALLESLAPPEEELEEPASMTPPSMMNRQ